MNTNNEKSMFKWVTDSNPHVNTKQCFQSEPPFMTGVVHGIAASKNIDIDTMLRGTSKPLCRCDSCKQIENPQVQGTFTECARKQ